MQVSNFARSALMGGVAAAAMLAGNAPAMAQSGQSHLGIPTDRIGVVGFTIREQIAEDARGTIQAVAECGIENIEFSGNVDALQGLTPEDVKAFAEEFGFAVPSIGVSQGDLADKLDQVIEAAQLLGAEYVRISGTRPEEGQIGTEEEYKAIAALLNEVGAPLKEAGITVAYHNHEYEYVDLGNGKTGYDILLEETDPELVAFELDLFWSTKGDEDAIKLIEENPGRFPLFHIKDATPITNDKGEDDITFATVGQGIIDFHSILEHVELAGGEYYFIENDRPQPDGITATCDSLAYMKAETDPR